jgi:hypothetical protein
VILHPHDGKEVTIPEKAKKVIGTGLTTAEGFTA